MVKITNHHYVDRKNYAGRVTQNTNTRMLNDNLELPTFKRKTIKNKLMKILICKQIYKEKR